MTRENNEALGLKVQELEAACAAKDAALERTLGALSRIASQCETNKDLRYPHERSPGPALDDYIAAVDRAWETARIAYDKDRDSSENHARPAALALDAGRAFLERLEKAEAEHANDLADLRMVMQHCTAIYMYASGGRVSKPNTYPAEVIALSEERENRDVEEAVAEARAQALEDAAKVADSRNHGELAAAIRALKDQATSSPQTAQSKPRTR